MGKGVIISIPGMPCGPGDSRRGRSDLTFSLPGTPITRLPGVEIDRGVGHDLRHVSYRTRRTVATIGSDGKIRIE
ncbi:MAG: hypothetical protein BWY68_00924 [bacterium ADurb.Bin400]|nr:MAG: hypothetical protein BWY68_00924 [bacterium ADurb.Bin400]